jgi:mRNA interferase MazF
MEKDKDFDYWNGIKKKVHNEGISKLYSRREIWWCALGTNVGFEQDGKGEWGERPVLILRGFSANVCLILPLTTSQKKNPYHISAGIVDGKQAFAITSQIRLIDTKRLVDKIGTLDNELFQLIRKAVKDLL